MLDVHVISHTHWDREWYLPLERFRQRLVALVDELIDDPPRHGESFLLDGQAIVLDDYLAVRPERAGELAALLRDGRLEAGPWYVLADELIPGGESLVRNLLTGRRTLARFGAGSPPVLYCPDSFGHPAALPAIAAGFGLRVIILWRGYGGRGMPRGDAARWTAPGGDEALLYHLPKSGYEFGSDLPVDAAAAGERWESMRAELSPRSATGTVLVPNGADHHARPARHRDALDALAGAAADGVHRSSLAEFAAALESSASATRLPEVTGELRDSYGYTWALQGTFATRAHEKRLNAHAERALVREAEPWSTLAARVARSRRALLGAAWRTLLEAHPHDTLCGCSIDEVAIAMEQRVRSATNQANGVRDDAVLDLIGHDPVEAREAKDRWRPLVVVRNPAARRRSGVAVVEVETFIADVAVGPGSGAPPAPTKPSRATPRIGGLGPLQVLRRDVRHSRTESPRHYPDNDLVSVARTAVWIDDAPPYGIVARTVGGRAARRTPDDVVATTGRSVRSGMLAAHVGDDGSVSLEHLPTGRRIARLLTLEDEADTGDLYTAAPRPREHRVEFRGVRRTHRGPLRGELSTRWRVVDSRRRAIADLTIDVGLDAGSDHLVLRVAGENREDDHRLRLWLATDVASPDVWADAAFGPVRRVPTVAAPADAAVELPPPTAPLHRYVSLFDAERGASVLSDGLGEYEVRGGQVAITLVRAVGELSRNDIAERPGHAGWPVPTPGAQCRGPFAASLAVMFHGPRTSETIDRIERASDDFLCPLTGSTLRSALSIPPDVTGPELIGQGLAFSAMKESEHGEWLVLRCVNRLDAPVQGAWRLPFPVRDARVARLDETPLGSAAIDTDRVVFDAGPRAIVTLLVR